MTDAPQQPPAPAAPQPQPDGPAPGAKPDYTMAWLCHLLMVLTWWLGPLIIWLVKKDEDKLVAFHGKQTLILGVACTVASMVLWILCLGWIIWILLVVYGIIGTVATAQGKPFKYLLVADKFCAAEFAAAYPDQAAGQQPPAAAPPTEPPA